ncbi:hypothetical protein [Streptomyces sp. MB09-02B]|uniref:hypothetical protein n=1 Tax=Streptomyces sp. MB09-02B TaxID=3028667 RepID=UPI0029A2DD2C|nr:hypothetical protein [Streptomyces sp. MB09-02B]MDX3639438.1 hypothetical protein [Streptomyces sp. MB09-02B]
MGGAERSGGHLPSARLTNTAQTSFAHYLDTVKAAIDTVLEEAATRGHRPTLTAIERHLGIPHATFHRHYADLIDTHFRPHIPATAPPMVQAESSGADERREANLARLRKENTELRRTLTLYEEAIRKLALENEALRTGATVIPLQARFRRTSQPPPEPGPMGGQGSACTPGRGPLPPGDRRRPGPHCHPLGRWCTGKSDGNADRSGT